MSNMQNGVITKNEVNKMKKEITNMFKNLVMFLALIFLITITTAVVISIAQIWFDPIALIVIVPFVLLTLISVFFSNN
jgi:ABC-type uncharacterized transport system fused permease/ATPase subunit